MVFDQSVSKELCDHNVLGMLVSMLENDGRENPSVCSCCLKSIYYLQPPIPEPSHPVVGSSLTPLGSHYGRIDDVNGESSKKISQKNKKLMGWLSDEPNAGLEPAASRLEVSRATIALAGPFVLHGTPL